MMGPQGGGQRDKVQLSGKQLARLFATFSNKGRPHAYLINGLFNGRGGQVLSLPPPPPPPTRQVGPNRQEGGGGGGKPKFVTLIYKTRIYLLAFFYVM